MGKEKRIVEPSVDELKKYGGMKLATEELLGKYDVLMDGVRISLGSVVIPSAKTSMTRIFSKGSFEFGGRFYSELIYMKSALRKWLYFDGEPTIEIDYKSLHPHMLYHQERLDFPGSDPYAIRGYERKVVKKAFNMMLNRGGKGIAKSAVNTFVRQLKMTREEAVNLEQAILAMHQPIQHHFNTGVGLRLQRLDSDIAMEVIDTFINVKKRPIIGVHDSFIVSVRDASALHELLGIAYDKYFNSTADISIIMNEEEGVGSVEGWVEMGGISETKLEFSEDLERAIQDDYAQKDGMDSKFWDELLAKEPVQEPI